MKNLLLIIFLVITKFSVAQTENSSLVSKGLCTENVPICEMQPQYPGGMDAFYKEISSRVVMEKNINGKVEIFFYVNCHGKLVNPKLRKGISHNMDDKILAVVNSMKEWTPARLKGESVDQSMVIYMEAKNGVLVKGKPRGK